MTIRPNLSPCIMCEKSITYLWDETVAQGETTNTDLAISFEIVAAYGSSYDSDIYTAIICDDCMTTLINKSLVTYNGNYLYPNKQEKRN